VRRYAPCLPNQVSSSPNGCPSHSDRLVSRQPQSSLLARHPFLYATRCCIPIRGSGSDNATERSSELGSPDPMRLTTPHTTVSSAVRAPSGHVHANGGYRCHGHGAHVHVSGGHRLLESCGRNARVVWGRVPREPPRRPSLARRRLVRIPVLYPDQPTTQSDDVWVRRSRARFSQTPSAARRMNYEIVSPPDAGSAPSG
jgi:hypothetical protein